MTTGLTAAEFEASMRAREEMDLHAEVATLKARLAAVEAERDEARRADEQRTGEWNRALERAERAEADLAVHKAGEGKAIVHLRRAEAALARAREVLREVESANAEDSCPMCGGNYTYGDKYVDHSLGCALKAALEEEP